MKPLTKEQKRVFDFIVAEQHQNGAPPTIREICFALGYKSVNNARQHLKLIEQKGYIRLLKGRSRGIEILVDKRSANDSLSKINDLTTVPLIGNIAAGAPITAEENIEAEITLDKNLFSGDGLFTLRIKGDSMEGIGVLNGDIVIIRQQNSAINGDVIAAIIDGEATLKRYIRKDDHIILRPENDRYDDIIVPADQNVWIAGKMVGVLRKC